MLMCERGQRLSEQRRKNEQRKREKTLNSFWRRRSYTGGDIFSVFVNFFGFYVKLLSFKVIIHFLCFEVWKGQSLQGCGKNERKGRYIQRLRAGIIQKREGRKEGKKREGDSSVFFFIDLTVGYVTRRTVLVKLSLFS